MSDHQTSIIEFSDDISNAEAPPPLPAGTYTANIVKAEAKVSATSGNRYLSLHMQIPPDQYPADFVDGDPDGTTLIYNRLLLEDTAMARYRLRKFAEAVGARVSRSVDLTDFLGLTANVEVGASTYEGEVRAEIKRVIAS